MTRSFPTRGDEWFSGIGRDDTSAQKTDANNKVN